MLRSDTVNNMQIYVRIKAVFLCILIMFVGCNKTATEKQKEAFFKEYLDRYVQANSPFADEDLILSTITFMDGIIEKEGNKNITSIYYDKATLLFKLKQYDEALKELFITEDDFYDVYKAALLIRLGRDSDAAFFLKNVIDKNKKELIEAIALKERYNVSREMALIQGTLALYIMAGRSIESILDEFMDENILTQEEAESLLQEDLFKNDIQEIKKILLSNMWPEN